MNLEKERKLQFLKLFCLLCTIVLSKFFGTWFLCSIVAVINIKVLPYSKEEYLNKKHKYYESHKLHKKVITESHIGQVVRETLRRYLQL